MLNDRKMNKPDRVRYPLPDAVRGLCVLGMVVYHALFDISLFTGKTPVPAAVMDAVRDLGASVFILLSGFCFHLGQRRLRRFVLLFSAGAAVTAVTALFLPEERVLFGILTFMAVSGGLLALLDPLLRRVSPAAGLALSLILFLLLFRVNYGYLGLSSPLLYLPAGLYRDYATAFFGFPFPGFFSGDYYPLLPWFFICLTGYYLYGLLTRTRFGERLLCVRVPLLSSVGRLALPVYLAHQPLLYGAVWLFFSLFG